MTMTELRAEVERAFAEGRADGGLLVLATLASEARCGLDGEGRWALSMEGGSRVVFDAAQGHVFASALETPRRRFDDEIEASARRLALPVNDVVWSFPAVDLIRAVLAKEHPYLTRLALEWADVTELRPLRKDIQAVAQSKLMPATVRDLATRLTVPE